MAHVISEVTVSEPLASGITWPLDYIPSSIRLELTKRLKPDLHSIDSQVPSKDHTLSYSL